MYRDLVYRPGEDSYNTRDLVFRPGVDTSAYQMVLREPAGRQVSFAEVVPFLPRPHTSFNPEHERLREVYDRAPYRRGPGSGGGIVADTPTDYGISERPYSAEVPNLDNLVQASEDATRKAQLLLELYMRGMGGDLMAALPEPMSQEEFQHEVTKRMDRNKPSVQDVLRSKFGVGSIREGIGRGIFPAPPRLPGI
jgi:hypothetical protein